MQQDILQQMNKSLANAELQHIQQFNLPQKPIIFVVGVPRSGTTILTQLLLSAFQIGYANNIVAKFWEAPYIGSILAKSLKDNQNNLNIGINSNYGFTNEYEGPHEFGYFWRRWFRYGESHQIEGNQIGEEEVKILQQEVAAMESVFEAPMLFKNPAALSLNIDFLAKAFPSSVFIHIQREPFFNAQSLLLGREKYGNSREDWFSVKPKEYSWLKEKSVEEQIAGQTYYTQKRIRDCLQKLPQKRQLTFSYESFCEQPLSYLQAVESLLQLLGCSLQERSNDLPVSLKNTNVVKLEGNTLKQLQYNIHQYF
ncbi:MAG: sulfotransferase [Chitinophagales bacterium]